MSEGWVKLHRKFYSGPIASQPPHYREIFIYLVTNANHKDNMCSGTLIRRGQLFTSYLDVCEKLHWYMGSKKEKYQKHHVAKAMNWLRRTKTITTTKTTRGLIVTICNYDIYQQENFTQDTPKTHQGNNQVTPESHSSSTINKNEKNDNNVKNDKIINTYNGDFDFFISDFNQITGKRFRGDRKSKTQLNARISEGFTLDEIKTAIQNCKADKFHIENPNYLTPEFITRTDKLLKYLNATPKTEKRQNQNQSQPQGRISKIIQAGIEARQNIGNIVIDLS